MERLTKRGTDGQAMMDCQKCEADWTGKHGKPMADCTALYCRNRLKDRLAAYEDRGCAPEEVLPKDKADEIALKLMRLADLESLCSYTRLRELAEADKDGRVVVLPCKEGDTIYHISKVRTSHFEDDKIIIDDEGRWKIYEMPFTLIHLPYIGKSYFLTREEAEKALEAMKNE
nr:MAG TPA: hypothetical protein [Caudoviricetes sp.]DAO78766.1 MAG TPA: hypothetical protein [Caudoviricetes sp.]